MGLIAGIELESRPGKVGARAYEAFRRCFDEGLLIRVTGFFRDPEAFAALAKRVIPELFARKRGGDQVRVWSAGCATGEEAYSIALLVQEQLEELKQPFHIQIFATDIDRQAIERARSGIFPASVATDISSERLARFFTLDADNGSYHIQKVVRDMIVFSEQDVIKDPPFSKLDLISCRNVLIYFDVRSRRRVI